MSDLDSPDRPEMCRSEGAVLRFVLLWLDDRRGRRAGRRKRLGRAGHRFRIVGGALDRLDHDIDPGSSSGGDPETGSSTRMDTGGGEAMALVLSSGEAIHEYEMGNELSVTLVPFIGGATEEHLRRVSDVDGTPYVCRGTFSPTLVQRSSGVNVDT